MNFIMAVDLNTIFVWVNVMNDDILLKIWRISLIIYLNQAQHNNDSD